MRPFSHAGEGGGPFKRARGVVITKGQFQSILPKFPSEVFALWTLPPPQPARRRLPTTRTNNYSSENYATNNYIGATPPPGIWVGVWL